MWNRFVFLALCLASPALAQVTPLVFEREAIRIESPAPKASDKEAKPGHTPLSFNTEIRPEDALRLEYIHMLNNLTDTSAVMIAFTAPSIVALPPFKVPTPVDALFVMDDGTVAQILPGVVLENMSQEIVAHAPVKAFLFLKAGTVAKMQIRPRDLVIGKRFTPAPPVME